MRTNLSTTLRDILDRTRAETEFSRDRKSLKRLKHMLKDAPKVISFRRALSAGIGLIAEIKERSPSQGRMLSRNVDEAPLAYKESAVVKAVSVLTNRTKFGASMTMENLLDVRATTSKPVLRKDFITDIYQVYQARAYGADAILLMANILTPDELTKLSDLAFELGMDVLFETHSVEELADLPKAAALIGINCRNFNSSPTGFTLSKLMRQWLWANTDKSVDTNRFDFVERIPAHAIKIAESGVTADNCAKVFALGFRAALVGTSLLMDRRGVRAALNDFAEAMLPAIVRRPGLAKLSEAPA